MQVKQFVNIRLADFPILNQYFVSMASFIHLLILLRERRNKRRTQSRIVCGTPKRFSQNQLHSPSSGGHKFWNKTKFLLTNFIYLPAKLEWQSPSDVLGVRLQPWLFVFRLVQVPASSKGYSIATIDTRSLQSVIWHVTTICCICKTARNHGVRNQNPNKTTTDSPYAFVTPISHSLVVRYEVTRSSENLFLKSLLKVSTNTSFEPYFYSHSAIIAYLSHLIPHSLTLSTMLMISCFNGQTEGRREREWDSRSIFVEGRSILAVIYTNAKWFMHIVILFQSPTVC